MYTGGALFMDMSFTQVESNKKKPKKAFKGSCGYCGEFGHKAAECPNQKGTKIRAQEENLSTKRSRVEKESRKERDIRICHKLYVFIVVNMDIIHMTV